MPPAQREIDQIAQEIHILEMHATAKAVSAIEFKIQIGKRLARAKAILPHGQFLAWATTEFSLGPHPRGAGT